MPGAAAATRRRGVDPLAQWRALFVNFLRREIVTRYLGSIWGLAWTLITPLALLGVYYFLFTIVFRAAAFGSHGLLAIVAVALWPWLAAQEAIQRSTVALASYAGLIRKVAFPHEIVVYATVAAVLSLQLIGYLVILVVLRLFGHPIHLSGLLVAIPLWVMLAIAVTGIGLMLSALQVFVRDVEHVMTPVLMMVMYMTPILYPLTLVPAELRGIVGANPFAWLVGRLRDALLEGQLAPRWSDGLAFIVAIAIFLAGRWVFRRLSPQFEDFV